MHKKLTDWQQQQEIDNNTQYARCITTRVYICWLHNQSIYAQTKCPKAPLVTYTLKGQVVNTAPNKSTLNCPRAPLIPGQCAPPPPQEGSTPLKTDNEDTN